MNKTYRRILLIAACIGFLIAAPAVVLYAIGYRPQLETGGAQQVGVLLVDAIPKRVDIIVNGQNVGRSPRAIANLEPGNVSVRVSKAGYTTWNKQLTIEPGRAVEVRAIRLFPEQIKPVSLLEDVSTFSLAPDRALLAAVTGDNTLHILDQEGERVLQSEKLPMPTESLLWSPDSSSILIKYNNLTYDIFSVTDEFTRRKPALQLQGITNVVWDPRIAGRLLALNKQQQLIAVSDEVQTSDILVENVTTFAPSARQVFIVTVDDKLQIHTLRGELTEEIPLTIEQKIVELYATPAGSLAAQLDDNKVVLIDEEGAVIPVAEHVQAAGWSPDGQMLFVQTSESELAVYNVENERLMHMPLGELHLVVRLSRSIHHPQWFAGGQHLIYQVDDEIVISEIDTRDYPVTTTLDSTNRGDANIAVGENGEVLYYLKAMNGRSSLHLTPLLTEEDL